MTESTIQFNTSDEAKQWLETQSIAILSPVHAQAKKLRDDMYSSIQVVIDVSKLLFDTSNKEIEKRNMRLYNRARALNKLARLFLDRLKKLTSPEEVSYDSLNKYLQDTQKVFMVMEIDIKNWFPRISPYFIMDRRRFLAAFERAKQAYNALNDFVNKEYVKTKTLEDALSQLNDLQKIEQHLANLSEDKKDIENERVPLEEEITDLEQKIEDMQSKGPIDTLNMVNAEIENLTGELKHVMRHLQKPFIKMQAMATSGGGGGITPDQLQKINHYLDEPFEALVSEPTGYPELREILQKLLVMLEKDSLKLKADKARKAEQISNDILQDNALATLQVRCKELATKRKQLVTSSKMDEIKRNLSSFQEQVDQLKARKTSVETHETVKRNAYQETVDKVSNLKRTIERNVATAIDKKIQIA